jgi:hypothetical protein
MRRLLLGLALWLATSGAALAQFPSGPSTGTGYPAGSNAVTGVLSAADTTTGAATLPAAVGKLTYIGGFTVSGLGAAAATPVSVTVATVVGGTSGGAGNTLTYSYNFVAGVALPNTPLQVTFSPPIPASAQNAAITVTVPGAAGNTATQINAWGYQQQLP